MPRRRNGKRGERISERDLEVLEFVVRFGVVPRSAVAVWAKTGRSVSFDRERRLREAGLIEVHPALGAAGSLVIATPLSLRLCGREELRRPRFSPWTARHSTVVAEVAARLERSGEPLLSEREIAAAERCEGSRIYSAEPAGRPHGYHRPDLLRLGRVPEAIEVELTNKTPSRLDALLRGWRRAVAQRKVARVIYLCPPTTLRSVERARKRIRAEDLSLIIVEPLNLRDIQLPRPESHDSGGLGDGRQGPSARPPSGVDGRAAAARVAARSGRGEVRWE
jgi:hypothetical protein